jgi:hypothetical protein
VDEQQAVEMFKRNPAIVEFGSNDLIDGVQYTSFYTRKELEDKGLL